jgi:hypothetical protein
VAAGAFRFGAMRMGRGRRNRDLAAGASASRRHPLGANPDWSAATPDSSRPSHRRNGLREADARLLGVSRRRARALVWTRRLIDPNRDSKDSHEDDRGRKCDEYVHSFAVRKSFLSGTCAYAFDFKGALDLIEGLAWLSSAVRMLILDENGRLVHLRAKEG